MPAANITCGRCRFCLGDQYPDYLCAAMEDYGNSLGCSQAPHLFGGWAEVMYLLPGTRLFRVPDDLPPHLAALTELFAVTHGLDSARLLTGAGGAFTFGDSVLVIGAGPLGMAHLARAELLGAGLLMATDVFAERLELARAFGADPVIDASTTSSAQRVEAVRTATGGHGADVVVDCSGRSATFPETLDLVRPGGTVIEAGGFVDLGFVPVNPNSQMCIKNVAVLGIGGERLDQYGAVLRMLARHRQRLPIERLITHRVGLEEVGTALELSQTGPAMKVLVTPNAAV